MFLPQRIALTIDEKLSSNNNISDAYLASSVPAIFIANPIFAVDNAGASFVPSPVTATTFSNSFNPTIIAYLSSGLDHANTTNL